LFYSIISKLFLEPTYPVLLKWFEKISNWKLFGAFLLDDNDGSKTEDIEKSCNHDVGECRDKMIKRYLKSGDVSWDKVLTSLRNADYTNVANNLESFLYPCKSVLHTL